MSGAAKESDGASAGASQADSKEQDAVVCLIIGMAGSGKSTFFLQLLSQLAQKNSTPYMINLDPAVQNVPDNVNIDIRDTVKYKEVMEEYGLGPNGAILTCLNLFCTKFDQVLQFVEAKRSSTEYVLVDTPGQIEAFSWSASGTIITESFAASLPTVILYIVDIPRCADNPLTFSSNMLHACSIMYKTKLPMVVVLNKCDIESGENPRRWMQNSLELDHDFREVSSYASTFALSMAYALDEFYRHITTAEVSSLTGQGFDELIKSIAVARSEYDTFYRPMLDELRAAKAQEAQRQEQTELTNLAVSYTHLTLPTKA